MENLEKEFLQLLEQESNINTYSKGDIIKGSIVKIQNSIAFIDIGQKTEAIINKDEIEGLPEGAIIEVIYTGKRKEGYPLLTRKPLIFKQALENIQNAFNENKRVVAKPVKKLSKGYLVDIQGIKAYLPNSQISLKEGENLPEEFEVYILNIDTSKKTPNIVVSRKKVLQEELNKQKEKLLNELQEGITIPVKVVKIIDKGVIVSIGDLLRGFLPASLYSWEKNKSISQLQEGQELELMVKQLDKENQKIILSKRDLEPNPWEEFDKNVGDKVEAVIIGINDYGLIVKVGKLEGFIHKSQTHHIYHWQFKKLFKEGQKVEAVITDLDREKRNLKLSITQAKPHPIDEFLQENPEGSEIEGKIKSIKNKVAFIDLGEIEGILHLEDATWNPKIKNIKQVLKGKRVFKFKVLGREKDKIRLGLKQFKTNPWEEFLSKHKVGDYVKGKIIKMVDRGAFVELLEDVEGFIPVKEISKEKIEIPSDKLSLGQEITAKIIKIKGNEIVLSIKAIEKDKEKKEIEEVLNKVKPKGEGLGTLGELIKKKLEEKKQKGA
ncbi:MAG: 30S ribosomal protein S1 [Hydrogenothermus sp.]|nr:MAG: 30S ribosomal protein S1 [Hydrogenothermus sp.]